MNFEYDKHDDNDVNHVRKNYVIVIQFSYFLWIEEIFDQMDHFGGNVLVIKCENLFFYLYGFTNVSSNLCYLRKHLDIGYKVKIYHLYVFSNVSSNIHYLRISLDTELKGMVSHLYVFWKESLNIYYLWKAEDINCKCIFFTCIYSQLSLQITTK